MQRKERRSQRAIGTGRRSGAHPGHHSGFPLVPVATWSKQVGTVPLGKPARVPRMKAEKDWRRVIKAVGQRCKRVFKWDDNGRMFVVITVNRQKLTVYIDDEHGQYRHCWTGQAIGMIRKAR